MGKDKGDNEKPAIFLVEDDLFKWETPPRPGYMRFNFMNYHAKTELTGWLGFDLVDDVVPGYLVVASAAIYKANVIRLHEPEGRMIYREGKEEVDGTPEELILFNGVLTVYSSGQIPGTELTGYDLLTTGKIWLARKQTESLNQKGLRDILYGDATTAEGKVKKVEAIVEGYEQMEDAKRSAQSRARFDAYTQGEGDAREQAFGTFGHGGW